MFTMSIAKPAASTSKSVLGTTMTTKPIGKKSLVGITTTNSTFIRQIAQQILELSKDDRIESWLKEPGDDNLIPLAALTAMRNILKEQTSNEKQFTQLRKDLDSALKSSKLAYAIPTEPEKSG